MHGFRKYLQRVLAATFVCSIAGSSVTDGQVVRGRVTDGGSGAPLGGVLVALERPPPAGVNDSLSVTVADALTDASGEFAIRAGRPGEYRVSAKRIGVQRYESPPIRLSEGETRRVDIVLAPLTRSLPTIAVRGRPLCFGRPAQAARIASLWDEVRTALEATRISARDRLARVSLYRYVREYEPKSRRMLSESRSEFTGVLQSPFRSISPESLSAHGYWRVQKDYSEYHVPDAATLLSGAFIEQHCFNLVASRRDRRGQVGVSFGPRRERDVPDIEGTVWVDTTTFELKVLEFRYTRLPEAAEGVGAGGEVRFNRMPGGAWIVRQWYVRMPQYASIISVEDRLRPSSAGATPKQGVYRILEEGGNVFADGARFFVEAAAIAGVVFDSAGRPLAGGRVRLAGSPFVAPLDTLGRFGFENLPSGNFSLSAEHPEYDSFDMPAASEPVTLAEGDKVRVVLRAANTSAIVDRLCEERPTRRNRGTVRLLVLHRNRLQPLRQAPIHLFWRDGSEGEPATGIRALTDPRGYVTFCDVPARQTLFIRLLLPTLEAGPIVATCSAERNEVLLRQIEALPPGRAADAAAGDEGITDAMRCRPFRLPPNSTR